jgi:hypothetical protein
MLRSIIVIAALLVLLLNWAFSIAEQKSFTPPKEPFVLINKNTNKYSPAPKEIIKEAIENNATLVQCLSTRCYVTATAEYVGDFKTGYYLVYQDSSSNPKTKAKYLASEIKRLSN